MTCNHKFQGHKYGVTCLLCGLKMTAEEYAAYLKPGIAEAPQKAAKKPKTPGKKKEATTNE